MPNYTRTELKINGNGSYAIEFDRGCKSDFVFFQGKDGVKGDRGSIGLPGDPGEPGLRGKDVSKS